MRHRVLATDAQERAVLASVRCLAAAGYCVTAVGSTLAAPALWSRSSAARVLAADPRRDVDCFIARLEKLVTDSEHEALLAGSDASLLAISQHRQRLAAHVRLGLPSHETVQRALDKERLAAAATRAGLAPPPSRVCRGPEDALAAVAMFGYPVLVKPARTVAEAGGAAHRWASVLARDARMVEAAARSFGACIVQRRVRGSVLSFAGVAIERGLLGVVVSRYARTWPREAGNACFSETILPPAGLQERVRSLLADIGWTGLFELELIDCGEERYAVIDFNPRVYGSMSLAVAAGVPLPALWCGWLLGKDPGDAASARVGVRYRWTEADLTHLVWRLSRGRLRSALSVARPHRDVTHPYLLLRDPAPMVARSAQIVVNGASRGKRALDLQPLRTRT